MQLLVLDGMPYPLAEAEHKVQSVWGIDRYTRRWASADYTLLAKTLPYPDTLASA